MKVYDHFPDHTSPRSLVLGTFDGLHIGHYRIISEAKKAAGELDIPLAVFTFDPSPEEFFNNIPPSRRRLLTRYDKLNIINDLSVDVVYELEFDETFMNRPPEEFVEDILLRKLEARVLCVGYDFKFGSRRSGDTELLQAYRSENLEVIIVPPVTLYDEPVGSSRIRRLLRSGDMQRANELLARPYVARETFQPGHGRGKKLGFPTMNFSFNRTIHPPSGVYLVWLGRELRQPGVANVGVHPTVEELDEPIIEVHTLGTPPELEPGDIRHIYFEKYCRPEEKFTSLEELKRVMNRDVEKAKEEFNRLEKPDIIHKNKLDV
ncbi:MAG: riboflavin biosynthesis protein RibF [bacterium]